MSNDALRHQYEHVMSLMEAQMQDLSVVQQKRKALTATARVASGTVEVTVNALQMVIKTVVEESYLDDHELGELGGFVTEAAQIASREVQQQSSALMAPILERRKDFAEVTNTVGTMPDLETIMSQMRALTSLPAEEPAVSTDGDESDGFGFPRVRL